MKRIVTRKAYKLLTNFEPGSKVVEYRETLEKGEGRWRGVRSRLPKDLKPAPITSDGRTTYQERLSQIEHALEESPDEFVEVKIDGVPVLVKVTKK